MQLSLSCRDPSDATVLPSSSVNLLPFHLKHTGPAPISTYFQPRDVPAPPGIDDLPDHVLDQDSGIRAARPMIRVAAFRGRRVQAYTSPIPEGYVGLILSAPPIPTSATIDVPDHRNLATSRVATLRHAKLSADSQESTGPRRSPRKRKVAEVPSLNKPLPRAVKKAAVKKFSLDSDSEEDEDMGSKQDSVKEEEVKMEVVGDLEASQGLSAGGGQKSHEEEGQCVAAAGSNPHPAPAIPMDGTPTPAKSSSPDQLPSSGNPPLPKPFLEAPTSHTSTPASFPDEFDNSPVSLRTLVPTAKFSGFTIWSPDVGLDPGRDEYVRALGEWMCLGKVLHRRDV